MAKNILVVDDEIKILEVIAAYLNKDGYNVFTATNGTDALDHFELNKLDLVILDLMLPDISGEDICKKIRSFSDVPIIMLTAKIDEDSVLNGYKLGTDDYITKPFSPRQLMAKVNALFKRFSNNVTSTDKNAKMLFNNELLIDTKSNEVFKNNIQITLTPTEYKVLILLAKNPNQVFSREYILDYIIGENEYVYDRTVDTHIKNLRSKIENNSKNPTYIKTVRSIGYKFNDK